MEGSNQHQPARCVEGQHHRSLPGQSDGSLLDTGPAIERMLAAGVSRRDLCIVMRSTAYEPAFGTRYSLSEPGSDPDDDVSTLYEELLTAEPSGTGGRPGSADAIGGENAELRPSRARPAGPPGCFSATSMQHSRKISRLHNPDWLARQFFGV